MRYFSYVFFLIPALLFLLLILLNSNLLYLRNTINFFWIFEFRIPVIAYFSIFFGLYVLVTWFLIKFSSFFTGLKTKKDESNIQKLKSQLQDWQWDLIKEIEGNFYNILEEYKKINTENINVLKKENEKIVSSLEDEIKNIKDSLRKIKK